MSYRNPRSPFVGSGTEQQGGFSATHKQDFNSHVSGTGFNHQASDVLMQPTLPAPFNGGNVQAVLAQLANNATTGTPVDSLYVSVGADGYSVGDFNMSGLVTFADALEDAFASSRLRNGGTVLIRAGYYPLTRTVTIPKGINLLGEAGGVFINRVTNGTSAFVTEETDNGLIFNTQVDIATTSITNINLLSNIYNAPSSQLFESYIIVNNGIKFELIDCAIIGTDSAQNFLTVYPSGVRPVASANILNIRNCYIDNFRTFVYFMGATAQRNTSICSITNCRIRYNAQSNAITVENANTFINNNVFIDVRANGSTPVAPILLQNTFNDSTPSETTDISTKVSISNNIGRTTANTYGSVFVQTYTPTTTSSTYCFIGNIGYDNYWDNNINSTSDCIRVGDGLTSFGDISGGLAINFLIPLLINRDIDLLIQPGTYYVYNETINVRFGRWIGTSSTNRPIIIFSVNSDLNCVLPCHLENLTIVNNINDECRYYSVGRDETALSQVNASNVIVRNCALINCNFNIRMNGSSSGSLVDKKVFIEDNFVYRQPHTIPGYAFNINDEFSIVNIQNNKVYGCGYFLSLYYQDSSYSYLEGFYCGESVQIYNIKNNVLRTTTTTDESFSRYVDIRINNYNNCPVNFENNTIYVNGQFYSPLLLIQADGDGLEFIYISALCINFNKNSVDSTYGHSFYNDGYAYATAVRLNSGIGTLVDSTLSYLNVNDCTFDCYYPLLVTIDEGTNLISRNISINNSAFKAKPTCLLITTINESASALTNVNKIINVNGCSFLGESDVFSSQTVNFRPMNTKLRKPSQTVFINANNYKINVTNNDLSNTQFSPSTYTLESNKTYTDLRNVTALYIDGYRSTTDVYGTPNSSTSINIINNNIKVYSCVKSLSFTAPISSTCIYVQYKQANISENYLYWTSWPANGGAECDQTTAVMGWLRTNEYLFQDTPNANKTFSILTVKGNVFDTNGDPDSITNCWFTPSNIYFGGNGLTANEQYKTAGIFKDNIIASDLVISPKIYHYRSFDNWVVDYKQSKLYDYSTYLG